MTDFTMAKFGSSLFRAMIRKMVVVNFSHYEICDFHYIMFKATY